MIQEIETGREWMEVFKAIGLDSIEFNGPYGALIIDYQTITMEAPDLAEDLLKAPMEAIQQGEATLARLISDMMRSEDLAEDLFKGDPVLVLETISYSAFSIRIKGLPESQDRTISSLNAEDIGKMVTVEAVVNVRSPPKTRIKISADRCQGCGFIQYTRAVSGIIPGPYECPKDDGGCGKRRGQTGFSSVPEECVYLDWMESELEDLHDTESPEKIKGIAEADLVTDPLQRPEAGDRVRITAIYDQQRKNPGKEITSAITRPVLQIIHIDGETRQSLDITSTDVETFKQKQNEALTLIKDSIAPRVYGYDKVKLALALQLFGGVTGERSDGSHGRGEIHSFILGDPGTGKTQLLKGALRLAPRGRKASGKGTSGVGLVGAVTKDDYSGGEWSVRAGVVAKADQGHALVDEIDKLADEDRDHLREATEEGEVSINKATVSATLRARTSLFMTANPPGEKFHKETFFENQSPLTPALKSRVDLSYYFVNDKDPERLKRVLEWMDKCKDPIHAPGLAWDPNRPIEEQVGGIRKYIHYARTRINPIWTKGARALAREEGQNIISFYMGGDPRTMDSIYRLAEASARSRLSGEVEVRDVVLGAQVLRYSLDHKEYGIPLGFDEKDEEQIKDYIKP